MKTLHIIDGEHKGKAGELVDHGWRLYKKTRLYGYILRLIGTKEEVFLPVQYVKS